MSASLRKRLNCCVAVKWREENKRSRQLRERRDYSVVPSWSPVAKATGHFQLAHNRSS
jgi:hypothetical protein